MSTIPLLIDIDGVLKSGKQLLPGCSKFLDFVSDSNIPAILLSNSTLKSAASIRQYFLERDVEIKLKIITAADATVEYVHNNFNSCSVYCTESVKAMFADFIDEDTPEVIVIGDIGDKWNYEILNGIFRKVKAGAKLVAMQKNRFWNTPEDGFLLDVGPFVKAIEYAANVEATMIGKPSKIYFESALNSIGFTSNDKFIMIGDDLETDIEPVQKMNGEGILIFTGKTAFPLTNEKIVPKYTAQNLDEIIKILEQKIL